MRSQSPSVAEIRQLCNLVEECRDLGDDPALWRQHYAEGLVRLVHPGLVMVVELEGLRRGEPKGTGALDTGWEQGFNREGWANACKLFDNNPLYCATMTAFFQRLAGEESAVHSRPELLDDDAWRRVPEREAVFDTMGSDHHLLAFQRAAANSDVDTGLVCFRAAGDRDYTPREKALLAMAQQMVGTLLGRSLARFQDPSPSQLPPRVRDTLRCLLEGDGDKQIAKRLGISPHTVNQYVKQIFRHFGVESRGELMARWVRRGWGGNGPGW